MELHGPGRSGWRRLLAGVPAFLLTVAAVAWLAWIVMFCLGLRLDARSSRIDVELLELVSIEDRRAELLASAARLEQGLLAGGLEDVPRRPHSGRPAVVGCGNGWPPRPWWERIEPVRRYQRQRLAGAQWELDRLGEMEELLPALERHVLGLQKLSDARAGASD